MNNQTHRFSTWSNAIVTALVLALICTNIATAAPLLSDDFNPATSEPNPPWRFYNPDDTTAANDPGESTLDYDGTNALISIPAGSAHNLWKAPNNKAPRVLQSAPNTDFGIEAKFETSPVARFQMQGIIVQESDTVFLRFDIFHDGSGAKLFAAYINGSNVTTHKVITLPNSPNYRQVIRSGDQWTFRYSNDGATWTNAVTFTQSLAVTEVGFFAGTAGSNPAFLSSVDYFMDLAAPLADNDTSASPAPGPTDNSPLAIDTWYSYDQSVRRSGQPGNTQKWDNILGNVSSDAGLSTFTYKINGGSEQSLNPNSRNPRLLRAGDYNIELDPVTSLDIGTNSVEIKATDINGLEATKTIALDYNPGSIAQMPYTANWGALTDIKHVEKIAHIVDGLWELTPAGIRPTQTGYDRTIAIGDITWPSNYQVTVPITAHQNFVAIGFAVGWQGHEGSQKPKKGWPLQALAWIRGPKNNPKLEIVTYAGENASPVIETGQAIPSIILNEAYILKTSSEPLNNEVSRFYVKFWRESEGEPTAWNLHADVPTRAGSVLLVDWHGGATYGNVTIEPLSGLSIQPDVVKKAAPTAIATGTPGSGTASLNVNFSGSSSTDTDGTINAYQWDFGDGSVSTIANPTHTYAAPGNYTATLTVTDNSGQSNTKTVPVTVNNPSNSQPVEVIDAFDGPLDTSIWTFYDPLGDSSLSMTGTQLGISVPAGTSHNLWRNDLFAPRIRRAASDTDFEVEVKFDSALSAQYQVQGITIEQDNKNLLSFEFYSDGSVTGIFSASFDNEIPSMRLRKVITAGTPLYLRVTRAGDQWIIAYSPDGNNWTIAGNITHKLAVTSVSVFGGNAGSSAPAHTALIDYFKVKIP